MLLNYKNENIILYSGGCRNTYFKTKRSGGNDEHLNCKLNKVSGLQVLRFHHVRHEHTFQGKVIFGTI